MANTIRPKSKITERELADIVDFKLNYLGNYKTSEIITVNGQHGSLQDGEVLPTGTRVYDIIQAMLDKDYQRPYDNPTFKLTGIDEQLEVGTKGNYTITPEFNQNDAGELVSFTLEKYSMEKNRLEVIKTSNTLFTHVEPIDIKDNSILIFKGTVSFKEGIIKVKDEKEVPGNIEAGQLSYTLIITGVRKCFYGVDMDTTLPVIESNDVRKLTPAIVYEGDLVPLNIPTGTKRITFAIPVFMNDPKRIVSKKLGYDVKEVFEKSIVRVKGNNGYDDIEYKVFTYIPDTKYPSEDTYTFEF